MNQIGRRFALSDKAGTGIFCDKNGVFVGVVPLLERICCAGPGGHDQWQPRPVSEINRDLSTCYGLPVECNRKVDGLQAVAHALSRGDVIHAQIATLHLQIPDPPALTKSTPVGSQMIDLARELRASGLLKENWNPAKHPRWPACTPDSIGGRFAPADAAADESMAEESSDARLVPAQITIPAPFDVPSGIPFPTEIVPPPAIPDLYPRELRSPYPDRAGCDEEWADAIKYCDNLRRKGLLRTDNYRGMGDYYQCVMGNVTERCGGFGTGT